MDSQKRIDTILETTRITVQDEIAALLGTEFLLTDIEKEIVTKTEAFEKLTGKKICAKIDLVGEVEGFGALFVDIKDAIQMAGTLIMLPSSELDEIISREEYSEEIEDAYGEIVNIVCGSFTSSFDEMHPNSFRFVKKELEKIVPVKIDIESDDPVKNELFYEVSFSMVLAGVVKGKIVVLLPAAPFDIQRDTELLTDMVDIAPGSRTMEDPAVAIDGKQDTQTKSVILPDFDVEKHRKRVNQVLKSCQEKMSEELGALLGVEVILTELTASSVCKEEFFLENVSGKQVITDLDVVGDLENTCFFSIGLKAAIHLGGLLIMLPAAELEIVVNKQDFGEDAEDAYGEIVNIASGAYTSVFDEQYPKKLRFIRKSIHQVMPGEVEFESAEPIPNVSYYLNTMSLKAGKSELGNIHMLFPAELLQLESLGQEVHETSVESQAGLSSSVLHQNESEQFVGSDMLSPKKESQNLQNGDSCMTNGSTDNSENPVDVLLIGDDEDEVVKLRNVLGNKGHVVRVLSFKDNVYSFISKDLKAVYLVTQDVDEQAFGVAIKVSSACSLPLIVAAPGWTKTKVIKAVKYGVRDILLTPANTEDIEENIAHNLVKLAA